MNGYVIPNRPTLRLIDFTLSPKCIFSNRYVYEFTVSGGGSALFSVSALVSLITEYNMRGNLKEASIYIKQDERTKQNICELFDNVINSAYRGVK